MGEEGSNNKCTPVRDTRDYYKKFNYIIEKKICVENYPKIKDYAKKDIYIYILYDEIDKNRFIFISSRQFKENSIVTPNTFKLVKSQNMQDNLHLKQKISKFGVKYYKIVAQKGDYVINFEDIMNSAGIKKTTIFKKYKTHNKKIALDYPDYYLEEIYRYPCKSHKKKVIKNMLYDNEYNAQIQEHAISTLYNLQNHSYQKFNDHSIVMDQGKTGKSSFIGHNSEKVDNPSMAGLYGSSDGVKGRFKNGLISLTQKSIVIDELNELIEDKKHEKVLSVLNSLLENGVYNYVKQHSKKIYSANQFIFLCNISDKTNFTMFLLGCFGNVETIGRRIGVITYNNHLNGYNQGQIIPSIPCYYIECISQYLSNYLNYIFEQTKFIGKLYEHKRYKHLCNYYKAQLTEIEKVTDEPIARQFIKSHKESIDRLVTRGLKLWLFDNIDKLLRGDKCYNNHSIYEILCYTEKIIDQNIINIRNIQEHVIEFSISDKKKEFNMIEFSSLSKNQKSTLQLTWLNKDKISSKGCKVENLEHRSLVKYIIKDIKKRGISYRMNNGLKQYGVMYDIDQNNIVLRFINKPLFESLIEGIDFKDNN